MTLAHPIRRVAIIGAGPSGLAALKFLLAEDYFERIDLFEQRSSVGGAWVYTGGPAKAGMSTTVPHLNPHEPVERPIWDKREDGSSQAIFVSPLYERLETNIPKDLMRFSDLAFPSDAQLFPKHQTVQEYLDAYAAPVKGYIKFETQVVNLRLKNPSLSTWELTTTNLLDGLKTTQIYDAVVVASGHFNVPHLPDITGIKEWDRVYPGAISHSKYYDRPEQFAGKKVVVVGNSASGLDIGGQISEMSAGPVIVSQRSESYFAAASGTAINKVFRPEIVEFLPPAEYNRGVRFADGHIEESIDAVVFCTGYFYSYPFLSSLEPPVLTDGWRTRHVYQQLFYTEHPTLVFPVLPQRVIPFPLAENQAAVFSRVWSQRLQLPPKSEMEAWEASQVDQKGDGKTFHLLPFPLDADYLEFLYTWAASAAPRPALSNGGHGRLGTCWTERERQIRKIFTEIRQSFANKGIERSSVRTLEELGYTFDAPMVKV
ncbi:Uncharacterized protein PECH_008563 [Penicillium ucsense]|uniref:Uncharacterized protein n=1 Tax=Penicillium ucsense TaxID=2839758 RepID=A0A8J8W8R1_9EURO|nr:Uncharacterized protein PECM_000138 [Penicillium ucsense]KAF7738574.1 Uncharacterized protein PECH_008563 [Penicillium ucsense]